MRVQSVEAIASNLRLALEDNKSSDGYVFVCIGSDKSTGDSYGPLVGTMLDRLGYHVIGNLSHPCHAGNLNERLTELPHCKVVIAIDACLGYLSSVGNIQVKNSPIRPGEGLGKTHLPEVGEVSITGVVNVAGFMEYFVLQNTRLGMVMEMAEATVSAIQQVIPLPGMVEAAAAHS